MVSGNTIGADSWSDGFMIAPMLMDVIKFSKCSQCNTYFWLSDNFIQQPAETTGVKELDSFIHTGSSASSEVKLLKEAFRSDMVNSIEKEIYLRIKLWQAINHFVRKYESEGILKQIKHKIFKSSDLEESKKKYSDLFLLKRHNLIRLSNLLKADKNEETNYLLFAEIYRETGDFSKAMIFCYKAETAAQADSNRIKVLKHHIQNKNKMVYKV